MLSSLINRKAEELQDEIFRKMSPDEKLKLWAGLWRLAYDLIGDEMYDRRERSKRNSRKNSETP